MKNMVRKVAWALQNEVQTSNLLKLHKQPNQNVDLSIPLEMHTQILNMMLGLAFKYSYKMGRGGSGRVHRNFYKTKMSITVKLVNSYTGVHHIPSALFLHNLKSFKRNTGLTIT